MVAAIDSHGSSSGLGFAWFIYSVKLEVTLYLDRLFDKYNKLFILQMKDSFPIGIYATHALIGKSRHFDYCSGLDYLNDVICAPISVQSVNQARILYQVELKCAINEIFDN